MTGVKINTSLYHSHFRMPIYDLGCPTKLGDPHFGLHNSVLGCFLATVCEQSQAQELQLLASSRYDLMIVGLTNAENYEINLIDNDCCENWTFSSANVLDIVGKPVVYQTQPTWHRTAMNAEHLIAAKPDSRVPNEKAWLQMLLEWQSFLIWLTIYTPHLSRYKAMRRLMDLPAEPCYEIVLDLEIKIKKILYTARDQIQTDAEIKALISTNHFFQNRYDQWLTDRQYSI